LLKIATVGLLFGDTVHRHKKYIVGVLENRSKLSLYTIPIQWQSNTTSDHSPDKWV